MRLVARTPETEQGGEVRAIDHACRLPRAIESTADGDRLAVDRKRAAGLMRSDFELDEIAIGRDVDDGLDVAASRDVEGVRVQQSGCREKGGDEKCGG